MANMKKQSKLIDDAQLLFKSLAEGRSPIDSAKLPESVLLQAAIAARAVIRVAHYAVAEEHQRAQVAPANRQKVGPLAKTQDWQSLRNHLSAEQNRYIKRVLEAYNGDRKLAAAKLGVSQATFYRKVDVHQQG